MQTQQRQREGPLRLAGVIADHRSECAGEQQYAGHGARARCEQ